MVVVAVSPASKSLEVRDEKVAENTFEDIPGCTGH